jgi:hypothetical protein
MHLLEDGIDERLGFFIRTALRYFIENRIQMGTRQLHAILGNALARIAEVHYAHLRKQKQRENCWTLDAVKSAL